MDSKRIALISLVAFSVVAVLALYHSISPYVTPSQLQGMEKASNLQVVGRMEDLSYKGDRTEFYLTDGKAKVKVIYEGEVKPMESEVVVVGDWKNGVLYAKQILRKCHTEYTGG